MSEHAGLIVYLWGVIGSLGTLFVVILVILGVFVFIAGVIILGEGNSVSIFSVKTEEDFNKLNSGEIPYNALCLTRKAFKLVLAGTVLAILIPSQSQIIKIMVAQPIVNTTKSVLTPSNLIKIQKIIDLQLNKLSK